MNNELTFRPTPLKKCLLGITIPLTKEAFFQSLQSDNQKDFAKLFAKELSGFNENSIWQKYETKIVNLARKVQTEAQKLDVTVITDFSLNHLKQIENYDVVTIIGHWVNHCNKIELADGLYSTNEFINAIPTDTECMLDLTVCNSVILQNEIKKYFRNIIVFGFNTPVSIQTSLLIYKYIIQEMYNDKTLNYMNTWASVKIKLYKYFQNKNNMKSLNEIVQKYVPAFTKLGEDENESQLNVKLEDIRNELVPFVTARTKQIKSFFIIFIVLIVVSALFAVFAITGLFKNSELLTTVASIFTIIGVAPLTFLLNVFTWIKERDDAKMLLKMIENLNKETFQSVLIVIATMLKK